MSRSRLPTWRVAVRLVAAIVLASASSPARAQGSGVVWESLGTFEMSSSSRSYTIVFLPAEGPASADPARDDIFNLSSRGIARYAPGEDNGEWGNWRMLCRLSSCTSRGAISTSRGVLLGGHDFNVVRSTDRGQTWESNVTGTGADGFVEMTLPGFEGQILATFDFALRSSGDGARNTWQRLGTVGGSPTEDVIEVPPSPMLPGGRLLMGVWNGVTYSEDGGASWRPTSAYGQAAYIGFSFTFAPVAGHPYGGIVFAGLGDLRFYPGSYGTVARSDDGGLSWTVVHRFDPAAWAMNNVTRVEVLATPDGVLWAGLGDGTTGQGPTALRLGAIVRSTDGGVTWEVAGTGYPGGGVNQLILARTGALYAATDRGVWRTTGPAFTVAGETSPAEAPPFSVSVRPNPAGGRAEVVLSLSEAQAVRVSVFDVQGREVAVLLDGSATAGERRLGVDTSAWPAGVYVVRVSAGAEVMSARLTVAR